MNYEYLKALSSKIKSLSTLVMVFANNTSLTSSFTGLGLIVTPTSTTRACQLSSSIKFLEEGNTMTFRNIKNSLRGLKKDFSLDDF